LPIDGHSFRRVEVLTGTPRRRRWSAEAKSAIVAESMAPGAVASVIALRHGLHRISSMRGAGNSVRRPLAKARHLSLFPSL
jgi:transposase